MLCQGIKYPNVLEMERNPVGIPAALSAFARYRRNLPIGASVRIVDPTS